MTAIQIHKDLFCLHRSYILVDGGGGEQSPNSYTIMFLIVPILNEKVRGLRVRAN